MGWGHDKVKKWRNFLILLLKDIGLVITYLSTVEKPPS